eukprot:CAMPEP_0118974498 /NCGR_PEP_ID=MMETSP1173-20130426/12108_1 /TAXON_ID=1034831 /ORGANISM="Rhizochromulina marina cf, Strain CCMP1243" /LENGTH=320 /DNA_ID=CAMNT_0006924249 /DNA_START=14 /DNA_END=976 /DNA_ORIENTATION=-
MPNAAAEAKKAEGNARFKAKDYRGAIEFYTQAIELDPTQHAYYSNRSACYAGLDQWEQAAEDGASCIRVNKSFIKGYFRLATAQEKMDQLRGAGETLTMGLAVEPRNKDLLSMKARIDDGIRRQKSSTLQAAAEKALAAGDVATAFKSLEQARAVDSGNDALQAKFEKVSRQYEAAEKSRRSNLSPVEQMKEQGDDKYKAGMFEEAIQLYSQCIDHSSVPSALQVKALNNRAACYKQLSNFDATISDCTAVLEAEPENVKALVRRAQAFEAVERYKLALQDVKYVMSLGINVAGQANYKLCSQMQGRLSVVIEKMKAGKF